MTALAFRLWLKATWGLFKAGTSIAAERLGLARRRSKPARRRRAF